MTAFFNIVAVLLIVIVVGTPINLVIMSLVKGTFLETNPTAQLTWLSATDGMYCAMGALYLGYGGDAAAYSAVAFFVLRLSTTLIIQHFKVGKAKKANRA